MFFKSQKSMDSFTIRSIDVRNSSNTISQENQTMKKIEENCLNNLATLIPTQQRRKSIRSFGTKDPDHLLSQNSTKLKYPSNKDNEAQQEVGFIQNYLGSHKKYKTYFKSKRYKKIYQQLSKKLPLQKSYFCLYMKDKFYALNKHIKVSLVHKETSFQEYLGPYFDAGKKMIKQFYKYFLVDDMLYIGTKKVNPNLIVPGSFGKPSNVCQFLYFIVTFLFQMAIFYRSKNQRKQAQTYYEANLKVTHKILQSSTSNSSLRRKISQYLISFSSFLIENRQLVKAIKILEMALQNCINLIAIVQTKLKYCFKGKHPNNQKDISLERFKKRTNSKLKEAFQFMMAIYLNSAVVFELQNKEYLSYLALNQVRYIEQVLYKNWSIKIRIPEVIKKPKEAFEYQHEKTHIIKCYFDMKAILKKQKQQKELEYNQNVAICGLTKSTEASVIQNKDLMELFFDEEKKKKLKIEKKNMSVITKKIGLIEYDNNQNQNKSMKEEPAQPTFQYTINMKTINGGQQTAVYNSIQPTKDQPIEANKLSPEVVVVRRGKKKLSNFYNLAMSQKQISLRESTNNRIDINSNQEIKKSEKTTSTLKSQKTVVPLPTPSVIKESKLQEKSTDFLDQLIDSQIEIKRYFLYGKDFVDKYDLLSKGKTLYTKKDKEKQKPYQKDFYNDFQDGKRIQYQTKNQIQILGLKNKNAKTVSHHTSSTTLLHKKNRPQLRHPFNSLLNQNQSQKQPVYIVCNQNKQQYDDFSTKENQLKNQNLKKRAAKSLKFEPMNYNEVMEKIKKTQIQFIKKDYNEKSHIYRLKCKSQNISRSKFDLTQMSNDLFNKSANPDTIANSLKKQKQSEAIASKFQSTQKSKNFLKDEIKKGAGKLTKKTVNSNMFSTTQTGIRLLKKIIFKHKKTLKINKTDLFVNYNKTEVQEQQIKLVDRQSFLMVQYNMCQEETKARIKENMRLLIVDNIRNSEENQKRVQKLNKAITAYDKNRRVNEFSVKMKRQYDGRNHLGAEKFILAHNPQYFAQTFANKNQRRDSQTSETDEMLRKIFQKRILDSKGDNESLGPSPGSGHGGDHEFLKKCKVKNPNLFLSSIQYKDEDEGFKKMKNVKNANKGQKENKLMDDIDEDEGQEKHKKQAIQKFLQLFKCNHVEEDQSEHDSKDQKDEEN